MHKNTWTAVASFSAMIAVILGAMASHYLTDKIPTQSIDSFKTAAHYQLTHSIVLLVISLIYVNSLATIKRLFAIGILLFSGSIYLLSTRTITGLEGLKAIGISTPIGGMFLIIAWAYLGFTMLKQQEN